jgi:hypothetical protein
VANGIQAVHAQRLADQLAQGPAMSFPNVSDIITTTIESRSGELADNVTNNNAVIAWIKKSGGLRPFSGGRLIYEELMFAENGNGGFYSGYDTLPVAAQDVITAAEFNIKQYAVPVSLSGLERLQNSGKEAFIDLLEGRVKAAEATMLNDLCVGIYSDGTGSGSKTITGLDAAVPQDPTTGTYGGINRATSTNTFWRSQLYDPGSTPTATTIQGYMNILWGYCSRGADVPNLIMAGSTTWATFMGSLQAIQRITDPSSATAGFPSVKYMTADVVLDGGISGAATATDMYFLNTKYLHWRPHKDMNMKPLGPDRYATNQDAMVKMIGWAGNLTCSGAKFQGRAKFD